MQAVAQAAATFGLGEQLAQRVAQAVQVDADAVDAERLDRFVDEVDRRFHMDPQAQQGRRDRFDALRERAFQRAPRRPRRAQVGGRDQVGDRLGLDQVELAVEEGALAELAGPGRARAEFAAALDQPAQQHRAAMRLQLGHVLAGETVRARERQGDAVVDGLAGGIGEQCAGGAPGKQCAAADRLGDRQRTRAGQADDADAAGARRGGDRRDRVVGRTLAHRYPVWHSKNPPVRRVFAGNRASAEVTWPAWPSLPARRGASSSTTAAAGPGRRW